MYRTCIFCSAKLGSNDSIERFPVGKMLAFDAAKGRLWAVCPKCARWNLSPIEERWEVIEDAEKLFRDARLRAQSENIGIAKLRDGTRLIRVGGALRGELALWRYGQTLVDRRRRHMLATGIVVVGVAALSGGAMAGVWGFSGLTMLTWHVLSARARANRLYRFEEGELLADDVTITLDMLRGARLVPGPADGGIALRFPFVGTIEYALEHGGRGVRGTGATIAGAPAAAILRTGMVRMNSVGAAESRVRHAVDLLDPHGADAYVAGLAQREAPLWDTGLTPDEQRTRALALEMALHEETERRAMEGELAALEAMWREAEGIAAIADRLPDELNGAGAQ